MAIWLQLIRQHQPAESLVCGLQRDNNFYPAWAYVFPTTLLRLPYSIGAAFLWACIVYYPVSPHVPRAGYIRVLWVVSCSFLGPRLVRLQTAQKGLTLSAVHLSRP